MGQEGRVHSKLLTIAARSILRPMGLVQKGRSRIWLDDRQWWVCVVEFQPSSWSRGSYLNVGCMWLWLVKDYVSFDLGHRVEHFHEFQDEQQFKTESMDLAARAAQEVTRGRLLSATRSYRRVAVLRRSHCLRSVAPSRRCEAAVPTFRASRRHAQRVRGCGASGGRAIE
jgi:hypothetical protein